jgi:hypothetical protein
MSKIIDIEKCKKEFGEVKFEEEKYILTSQAEHTNRLLSYKDYHETDEGEEYNFEMSANAVQIDEDCNIIADEYKIYWIFSDIKGSEKELDQFDYEDIDRVENI